MTRDGCRGGEIEQPRWLRRPTHFDPTVPLVPQPRPVLARFLATFLFPAPTVPHGHSAVTSHSSKRNLRILHFNPISITYDTDALRACSARAHTGFCRKVWVGARNVLHFVFGLQPASSSHSPSRVAAAANARESTHCQVPKRTPFFSLPIQPQFRTPRFLARRRPSPQIPPPQPQFHAVIGFPPWTCVERRSIPTRLAFLFCW
jgi:hypothetical protein